MRKVIQIATLIFVNISIIGCAAQAQKNENINEPGATDLILCQEPRPEICTREYKPVCATRKDGSQATGSTGCTSCSDPDVVGYTMGGC